MLSDRRQRVLTALINEYISRALPVGSRTLVEHYPLGVSSATVRNELSVLEDDGYITQPHTSSGRIPTDNGYRAFVDELLSREALDTPRTQVQIEALTQVRERARELDELIDKTSEALTELTSCLSVVLPPTTRVMRIRQITLVSLTPRKCLSVVVTEDAQVVNRNIDFSIDVDSETLAHIQHLLNIVCSGKDISEIPADIEHYKEFQAEPLARYVLDEICDSIAEEMVPHAHAVGLSSLLKQPEFKNSQALMPVLQLLEDDTVLLELLRQDYAASDTLVRIGHEHGSEDLSGVSVVATQYGRGVDEGVIAIIGPTRMDYAGAIQAVRLAKVSLEQDV